MLAGLDRGRHNEILCIQREETAQRDENGEDAEEGVRRERGTGRGGTTPPPSAARHLRGRHLGIDRLDSLRLDVVSLDLSGNGLQRLPAVDGRHGKRPRLQFLSLARNRLRDLASVVALRYLRRLDVSHNAIKALDCLHELPHLEVVRAASNSLASLANIRSATLVELDVSNNALATLEGVQQLPNLQSLAADGNVLVTLLHVTELSHLRRLSARSNRIGSVMELGGLATLHHLRSLDLTDNPVAGDELYEEHLLCLNPR